MTDNLQEQLAHQFSHLEMASTTQTLHVACQVWHDIHNAGNDLATIREIGATLDTEHPVFSRLAVEISKADVLTARHWASSTVVGMAEVLMEVCLKVQAVVLGDADTINAIVKQHLEQNG